MSQQCKRVFQLCPIIRQLGIAISDPFVAEASFFVGNNFHYTSGQTIHSFYNYKIQSLKSGIGPGSSRFGPGISRFGPGISKPLHSVFTTDTTIRILSADTIRDIRISGNFMTIRITRDIRG
jgi:hypothetical protein